MDTIKADLINLVNEAKLNSRLVRNKFYCDSSIDQLAATKKFRLHVVKDSVKLIYEQIALSKLFNWDCPFVKSLVSSWVQNMCIL